MTRLLPQVLLLCEASTDNCDYDLHQLSVLQVLVPDGVEKDGGAVEDKPGCSKTESKVQAEVESRTSGVHSQAITSGSYRNDSRAQTDL